jgi:short-subunit dehydrogenase
VKTIIITGCSSGIGFCLATNLHNHQEYEVVATARTPKDIKKLQDLGIKTYPLDLADKNSVDDFSKQVLTDYSNIYAIIHNGAYGQAGALMDISREVLESQFATNLFGTHQLTNNFLPNLLTQKSARIIYISSVLGIVAAPFRGCYNSSKFALEGLAQTLRLELFDTNIKVSTIQPGPITSKFRDNAYQSFVDNVDENSSIYKEKYQQLITRLTNKKPSKWTLPPEAVLKQVIHAMGKKPKNHYLTTTPTKVIWFLKKFLSSKVIDRILVKQ